jgi:uncharacterized membrane protein YfcA
LKNEKILESIIKSENTHFPFAKLAPIWVIFISLTAIAFLKGTKSTKSVVGVEACTPAYWIIVGSFMLLCIVVYIIQIRYLISLDKTKREVGYEFHKADIIWTKGVSLKLALVCLMGGTASGTLGIGGGLIYNPLLIELGKHPIVASSTGMYLVLYSSMATCI